MRIGLLVSSEKKAYGLVDHVWAPLPSKTIFYLPWDQLIILFLTPQTQRIGTDPKPDGYQR